VADDPVLTGDQLVDDLWMRRAAVENWARLNDISGLSLVEVRMRLLDELGANGRLTLTPPAWMTSAKPGVDAWIEVPGGVLAVQAADPDDNNGRRWLAANCLASRRRPGRRGQTAPARMTNTKLDAERVAQLTAMTPAQLREVIWLSEHSLTRLHERALRRPWPADRTLGEILDQTWTLIEAGDGRVQAQAPDWADAAGTGGPSLIFDLGADAVAMPLQPDIVREGMIAAAATALSRRWVRDDLLDLTGDALAGRVQISAKAAAAAHPDLPAQEAADALTQTIAAHGQVRLTDRQVRILLPGGQLVLRPANGSWAALAWLPDHR